jgi:hypothetical protein
VELAHDFYFVDERLLALFLTVGALLRKGLHCVLFAVLMLDHQIDSGEIALSDLLDGFEELVKAPLVQSSFEEIPPLQQILVRLGLLQNEQLLKTLELEAIGLAIGLDDILTVLASPQQFEDEFEVEGNPQVGHGCKFLNKRRCTLILRMMQS